MRLSYETQLVQKRAHVQHVLAPYFKDVEITPSPEIEFYRNRMDFWYDSKKTLGFRSRENSERAFPAPECQLMSREAQHAYHALVTTLSSLDLPFYEITQHEGFLRYIILRESKTTHQRVLGLVTFTRTHAEQISHLVNQLLAQNHISGAVWIHNPAWGDTSNGEIIQEWGETTLREDLNGMHFSYSFPCFFQTNPHAAGKAQEYVSTLAHEGESVLDLYCGVGLFSIPLAARGHHVKGIEMSKDSISWARKNAHAHGLDDDAITFSMGDVPKALQECEKNKEGYGIILLDPPRSGLSKKIWRRVLRLRPRQLIYVSCNPDSLGRDLDWLREYARFTVENARAFDFFPHTDHVETILSIRIDEIREFPKGG